MITKILCIALLAAACLLMAAGVVSTLAIALASTGHMGVLWTAIAAVTALCVGYAFPRTCEVIVDVAKS